MALSQADMLKYMFKESGFGPKIREEILPPLGVPAEEWSGKDIRTVTPGENTPGEYVANARYVSLKAEAEFSRLLVKDFRDEIQTRIRRRETVVTNPAPGLMVDVPEYIVAKGNLFVYRNGYLVKRDIDYIEAGALWAKSEKIYYIGPLNPGDIIVGLVIILYGDEYYEGPDLPVSRFEIILEAGNKLPDGTYSVPYTPYQFRARNGIEPYSWTVTYLPAGLSCSTSGLVTGTPTGHGLFTPHVKVRDMIGQEVEADVRLMINVAKLMITTENLDPIIYGNHYSFQLECTGGYTGKVWTATGLPSGLSCSESGLISGTTTSTSQSTIIVTVTDSLGDFDRKTWGITPGIPALVIDTTVLPDATETVSYSFTLTGHGGVPPLSWRCSGLPNGLEVRSATGEIFGIPATSGSFSVIVRLTDSKGAQTEKKFTLNVSRSPITITTGSLPDGIYEDSYSKRMEVSGSAGPFQWSATGLPNGLSITATGSSAGMISGTPSGDGYGLFNNVKITVKDSQNSSFTKTYSIMITVRTPQITTSTIPQASMNIPYSFDMSGQYGVKPYSWSATGLPNGLSMSNGGKISGTPTQLFNGTVKVTLTDSDLKS